MNTSEDDQMTDKILRLVDENIVNIFKVFVGLGLFSALTSTLFYELLPKGYYYYFNSASFLFYSIGIYTTTNSVFKHSKVSKLLVIFVVLATFSNFMDELFYNATEVEWNDIVRLIIIIIFTLRCRGYIAT